MGKKDPRVDAYISRSAGFAKPVLDHIRELVHRACPEASETIKWGFPHFEYKGLLCSMASFKTHCAFSFWLGTLLRDPHGIISGIGETSMGHFGRITSLGDLPGDDIIIAYIQEAVKLNEAGVKKPAVQAKEKKELQVPEYFAEALSRNKKALETFEKFSYSNKKDYVEWITEAKTEATREKRIETALQWLEEGKIRNWKYVRS
jgi:uncharacterized protein YdeI (YjbR/CyaY-like superfamily)